MLSRKESIGELVLKVKYLVEYMVGIHTAFNPYPYDPLTSYTYEDLKEKKESCFKKNSVYGNFSDVCFNNSIIYIYNKSGNSSIQNISDLSESSRELIDQTSHLDRIFPSMLTPYILENIFRINIAFKTRANGEIVMRTFPAYNINSSYSFDSAATDNPQENWYIYSQENDSVVSTGPYIDTKGSNKAVISLSHRILKDGHVLCVVQIEVLMQNLASILETLKFMETGISTLVTNEGFLIYVPEKWSFNTLFKDPQNSILDIKKYPNRTGITTERWNEIKNISLDTVFAHKDIPTITKWNEKGVLTDYYLSSVILPHQYNSWEFALLLYVEKNEVFTIETSLKDTIYRQNQMILFMSMNSCVLTIAIVICFCYNVAMSISRPLRKLIKIASLINNNATQKNRVSNIQEELPMGEYQIGELIEAFKNLIGFINNRNKSNKNTIALKKEVEYPHNQYDPEFVAKAKGDSDVNWHKILEEIEDEAEF